MTFASTAFACASSYAVYKFVQMILMGRRLRTPVYMFLSDATIWRMLFPSWVDIPGVVYGNMHPLRVKHSEFDRVGMEAYSLVSFEKPNSPATYIADLEAIREIVRPKAPFLQDVKSTQRLMGTYGPNILTLEGDAWKRHRRITHTAFSEENTKLVWSESVLVVEKLFDKWEMQNDRDIRVARPNDIMETLALMVISSAALGQRMSWDQGSLKALPSGHTLSFQQAVNVVARKVLTRATTPGWAEGWSKNTRNMATGFMEFGKYLRDMVASYRRQGKLDQDLTGTETLTTAPTNNLFSILMTANEQDARGDVNGFTDEETTGSAFLFLMAGHETTAHALAFSLGLLAAYPDIQQQVQDQIKRVLGCRERLEYSDYDGLKLVTGTFLEAIRLYPAAPRIPKLVDEDSVLTVARNGPGADGSPRETIFLPAKSHVVIAVAAVHYNPRYWPEPDEFRPARFVGSYNKDAFLGFGLGRRACVGRKFAETEGTAVLATILARYEIMIDHSKFTTVPGETLAARRERLLRPFYMLTMAPENLPLIFRRR